MSLRAFEHLTHCFALRPPPLAQAYLFCPCPEGGRAPACQTEAYSPSQLCMQAEHPWTLGALVDESHPTARRTHFS
jgi:hypothetical protein